MEREKSFMPSGINVLEKIATLLPDRTINRFIKRMNNASFEKRLNKLSNLSPDFIDRMSEKRLLYAFHRAANRVPHYNKFLNSNNIDAKSIKTAQDLFKNVPPIDKKSYIQTSQNLSDLCVDGKLHEASLLCKSSGFSGNPCIWPRSYEEEEQGRKQSNSFFNYLLEFDKYKTLAINTFFQGAWIAGTSLNRTLNKGVSLFVSGTKSEEAIEIIEKCRNEYDQIVIFGYPPFLKLLIDLGKSEKDDFWTKDSTRFILIPSSEGFSEGWREYINRRLNKNDVKELNNHVYSTYGSSDLGIFGSAETPTTVKIRQAAYADQSIAEMLFGDTSKNLPMLFNYNPLQFHINLNDKSELEFSTLSPDTLVPLIKYNIHDMGGIIRYGAIENKLESAKISLKLDISAPMFYLYGRASGEVRIAACMIYPENISDALFSDRVIAEQITGAFKIRTEENSQKNSEFILEIELRDNVTSSDELKSRYEEVIHNYFYKTKEEYAISMDNISKAIKVKVIFKKQGELQNEKDIKIHYI